MKLFIKTHLHILSIAFLILLVHFYNNLFATYGLFRDELYYIACSENLSFGYVDQPPLCAVVLRLSRMLFGESVFAIRIIPSLAHAGTIIAAGLIAKKMGGEKFAQLLSALIIGFAPGFIGIMGIYSMNALEIFLWSVAFYLLLLLIET
ncbi:MAG: glycosyltransferase family 39 protein, partial [Bacteroidota bacterium]